MSASQQLIQQLLNAEQEAEKYIATARENRTRKLREARSAAESEMESFKQQEEARFQKDYASKGTDHADSAALQQDVVKELQEVERQFQANKTKTADYMFEKVLTVQPVLSAIQISTLKRQAA